MIQTKERYFRYNHQKQTAQAKKHILRRENVANNVKLCRVRLIRLITDIENVTRTPILTELLFRCKLVWCLWWVSHVPRFAESRKTILFEVKYRFRQKKSETLGEVWQKYSSKSTSRSATVYFGLRWRNSLDFAVSNHVTESLRTVPYFSILCQSKIPHYKFWANFGHTICTERNI